MTAGEWGAGDTGDESSSRPPFGGQRADDSTTGAPSPGKSAPSEVEAETAVAEESLAEQAGVPSASQMDPDPDRPVTDPDRPRGTDPDRPATGANGEPGSDGEQSERFRPEAGREDRSSSGTETSSSEGDPVATAVAVVAKERDDFREALIRLQADFENYKKRVAKQQEDLRERAAESLVEKLLPVLDTADLALTHGAGEDVKQLSASLFAALEKEGLEKIDNAGEAFDPTRHDAVAHEPGDGDGGQEVAEVMRAGYRWRGRVLRPAMVKVRG